MPSSQRALYVLGNFRNSFFDSFIGVIIFLYPYHFLTLMQKFHVKHLLNFITLSGLGVNVFFTLSFPFHRHLILFLPSLPPLYPSPLIFSSSWHFNHFLQLGQTSFLRHFEYCIFCTVDIQNITCQQGRLSLVIHFNSTTLKI